MKKKLLFFIALCWIGLGVGFANNGKQINTSEHFENLKFIQSISQATVSMKELHQSNKAKRNEQLSQMMQKASQRQY